MIERIIKNEDRLDISLKTVKELETALTNFNVNCKNIKLLNKYYGSKEWFKDKEKYEEEKNHNIKAGVLSEDAVWNLLTDLEEIKKDLTKAIKNINNVKKL